jgi:hypothetical protein
MLTAMLVHSLCLHLVVEKASHTQIKDCLLRLSDDISRRIVEANIYLGASRIRTKKVFTLGYCAA